MMNTMKNSNLFTEDKNEETYHDLGSYIEQTPQNVSK